MCYACGVRGRICRRPRVRRRAGDHWATVLNRFAVGTRNRFADASGIRVAVHDRKIVADTPKNLLSASTLALLSWRRPAMTLAIVDCGMAS